VAGGRGGQGTAPTTASAATAAACDGSTPGGGRDGLESAAGPVNSCCWRRGQQRPLSWAGQLGGLGRGRNLFFLLLTYLRTGPGPPAGGHQGRPGHQLRTISGLSHQAGPVHLQPIYLNGGERGRLFSWRWISPQRRGSPSPAAVPTATAAATVI